MVLGTGRLLRGCFMCLEGFWCLQRGNFVLYRGARLPALGPDLFY